MTSVCNGLICFFSSICSSCIKILSDSGAFSPSSSLSCQWKVFFFLTCRSEWYVIDKHERTCHTHFGTLCVHLTNGVARTFGAHGQRTLRGPSPFFITLFLWPLPHIHPYSDFAHVYLYYIILNTALFNQYTSHGVSWKFGSPWWRDGGNGAPWWRNEKWDPW